MICVCVVAQMKRYDTDFLLSRKNFVMTMPIEVERDQLFVTLEINGRPYRFKLDTGASQGVIYDDVDMPGLRELGYIKSEDAIGTSRQVATVELPPMTLDSLTISHFKVQRMPRRVVRRGEDGIIGFALFHYGLAARIDARAGQMTLTDRRNYFKGAEGEVLKYHLVWHVPYVKVSPFEGIDDVVLFDTGSPMLYAPNGERWSQMEATAPAMKSQTEGVTYGSRTMGHFGSEHARQITLLKLDHLKWGAFDFQDVHCATVQGGSHVGAQLEATVPDVKSQTEGVTYGRRVTGHFGDEQDHQITLLKLDHLKWGTFDFQDVRCATVQGGSHVGAQLLQYGAMVINPFRRLLVFQPYDGATSCQEP